MPRPAVVFAYITVPTLFVLVATWAMAGEPGSEARPSLRLARSDDGLRFSPDAEVFVEGGASPGLTRLQNDELIAVYDAPVKDKIGVTEMTLRRSKDGGRTWSQPQRLEWDEKSLARRVACHPELVVERDDTLRLYFAALPALGKSKTPPVIRSATARGEMRFKLDREAAARCRGMVDPVPCVMSDGPRRVMLLSDPVAPVKSEVESKLYFLRRSISRNGGRFVTSAPVELDDDIHITSVISLDKGLRAYGWSDDGIVSLRSDDLKEWDIEEGVRWKEGWDPAVTRMKDGTYVMVYNAGPRPKRSEPTVADIASLPAGSDVTPSELEELTDADDIEEAVDDELPSIEGMAPLPDFAEPVDYTRWYRDHLQEPTDDNAYDAYVSFMPRINEDGVPDREDWPIFNDMYNSGDHQGPPGPWKPEDQPGWEETHRNVQEVLGKFREANLRTGFARRVDPIPDSNPTGPSEDRLLLNLLFPDLGPHRTLAKATLSDSWRVGENGKVDPQQMIDAWKTVLRGAEHMERGSTLIENLVGIAERQLVESNARWALKQGVVGEKELQQAYDALREYDLESTDAVRGVRGEHAMALDTTQYLFSPPDANGQPKINPDRVERLKEVMGDESGVTPEEVAAMGPEDVRTTIEAFNSYYREMAEQMRIGYPDVRAADLDALEQQYLGTSPITKMLLPSLSRVHHLRARSQASRRATQLAYAVHIHHARTGQWPKTLDELPKEFSDEIRTDPFTGRSFGYRVGRDGPTIYSASENGVDDGGVHAPRWGSAANETDSDDHVLWPPQE